MSPMPFTGWPALSGCRSTWNSTFSVSRVAHATGTDACAPVQLISSISVKAVMTGPAAVGDGDGGALAVPGVNGGAVGWPQAARTVTTSKPSRPQGNRIDQLWQRFTIINKTAAPDGHTRRSVVGVFHRRPAPVVVTDLHEPLYVVHARIMRFRLVLFGVWLVGWVVSGLLWREGWLATAILLGSGPGVWLVVGLIRSGRRPGRREPVGRRALGGPGAGAAR
jgi:hypothetical protein